MPPDPKGYGDRVTIRGQDGKLYIYAHLDGQSEPSIGQRVEVGQKIGEVGRSGNVPTDAASHLHFEVRDKHNQPIPMRESNTRIGRAHELSQFDSSPVV